MKVRDLHTSSTSAFSNIVTVNVTSHMSDDQFLDMIQKSTFRYFWNFAHPTSGLIYESSEASVPSKMVSTASTGFGLMAIIVGIERGFITREQGVDRILKIVNFLANTSQRFHGSWPHWMNGETGEVILFADTDDGADLVETTFLIQGLLTVGEFFKTSGIVSDSINTKERRIQTLVQRLWEEVEWNWFRAEGKPYLYWHWSPNHGYVDSLPIQGYNEAILTYILAISSPTHSIPIDMYHTGWAKNGDIVNGSEHYGITLPLGEDLGGPMFLVHYSFLGLDPTKIGDKYIDSYYEQGRNQTLINRAYCIDNPRGYLNYGENSWGLTASQSPPPPVDNYNVHQPDIMKDNIITDNGTIAPTAAISSMPYPRESIEALKYFTGIMQKICLVLWGFMMHLMNPKHGFHLLILV